MNQSVEWVGKFRANPKVVLAKLIRGKAMIPPHWVSSPDDALYHVVKDNPVSEDFIQLLDKTLLDFLTSMMSYGRSDRNDYGLDRYVADIISGIRIANRLNLSYTLQDIKSNGEWTSWLDTLPNYKRTIVQRDLAKLD